VVSTGQTLRIEPNDEREIVQISVLGSSNNEDGRQSHFNDASQVLFGAQFADDSVGLFVATPQAGKCDVNIDGRCNVLDIDDLANAIRNHSTDDIFDIDASGALDSDDFTTLVETEFNTWIGDANLDGVFDSSDLVSVFVKAEYEDQFASNSTWSDGDWNGDAEFDSADLVAAFVRAGYEMGHRPNVNRVPEPGISSVGLILLFGFALRRSKSNRAAVTLEPLND
jgi:hypothetical protein